MTKVHLVLVDDWELRGDGSGDMRAIQFEPLAKLLAIYERHGLKASLSAELMQQLTHRERSDEHPALKALADEWDDIVRDVSRRGHDVQLHLHPQWLGAKYESGKWTLPGDWSLTKHRPEDVRDMLRRGRDYLVNLIRPVRPDYEVISFKAGAWAIAPSDHLLDLMAEAGIRVDLSVFPGAQYDNARLKLDYRDCEETFLPFYPDAKDARRVATRPGPVVCFPGNHRFIESQRAAFWHRVRVLRKDWLAKIGLTWDLPKRANEGQIADTYSFDADDHVKPPPPQPWRHVRPPLPPRGPGIKGFVLWMLRPPLNWIHNGIRDFRDTIADVPGDVSGFQAPRMELMADLSALTAPQMLDLLKLVRQKARDTRREVVPVVLENHTKDIRNHRPFEKFARALARARDIEVVTLTDLKKNLDAGLYQPVVKVAVS